MKFVEDLGFFHFNTSEPGEFSKHCESAFALWEEQWVSTFAKSKLEIEIFSDEFLNRELGGLFFGTKAVGFMLYSFFDFSKYSSQKARYFKNYPREVWASHHQKKDLVFSPTHMTLHPDWRKSNTNLPISELLFGFSLLRFLDSSADRLIGYARNDLKMNEVLYRHGGYPLATNLQAYNTPVDFIEISRASAHLSDDDACAEMNLMFWNKTKSRSNHHLQTVLHKRKGKNHVVTLYQPGTPKNDPSGKRSSMGKQSLLSGLARPNLPLHSL